MAVFSIPETTAPTHYVELADSEGRLVLLPRAMVDAMRAAGRTTISMTIGLTAEPSPPWLSVTEAAELHLEDLPPAQDERERHKQLLTARANISRACSEGKIACVGEGPARRVNPNSLAAWRLMQRDRYLRDADI